MRIVLLTLVTLLVGSAPASAAARPDMPWLRAVRGEQARFETIDGRQAMLRGVNVNQLGDYFQKNAIPPTVPLERRDFAQMRNLGFNSVRLVVSWSALEPQPGAFSEEYVARIRRAVAWGKRYGIYTLIDMHQDAWGKYIAARPGEVCPPGFTPNIGWDGAPEWATFTDGMARCYANNREISPAVAQAFQSFWDDRAGPGGVGIQARLVETWRKLAERFKDEPAVMGYDLLNEPNPGFVANGNEERTLVPYYRRAIAAIRSVDRRHTIFIEPQVLRSGVSDPIRMPFVSDDPNLAYAPHIYADRNGASPEGTGRATEREWTNAMREAREAGGASGALPLWIGEFGALDPPARAAYNEEFMALADRFGVGWSHWVWKDNCGDPHDNFAPFPDESFHLYECPANRYAGIKRNRVASFSRPYPMFAGGQITSIAFDPGSKRFELRGTAPARARRATRVFVPLKVHYGRKLSSIAVSATGLRKVRVRRRSPGTAEVTGFAAGGEYRVVIERRRR